MATLYAVHGDTGTYIEVDCLNADGSTPDFTGATLQVEVFRLPNTLVLDGTPTSPSSGKLRYTFTSGNWTTIPNRTQHYAVTWHATIGGVRRSYPGEGYDTLVVTADPQGVPADADEVAYLTVASAASTYARRFWFNVLDYGALGDGVADDTAAIGLAYAAAVAAGGGVILFPDGLWLVADDVSTGTIFTISSPNVCFLGVGRKASIIKSSSAMGPSHIVFNVTASRVRFADLGFTAVNDSASSAALNFSGASKCDVDRVWVDDQFGWSAFIGGNSTRIGIRKLESDGTSSSHNIEINDSSYCRIEDCDLIANTGNGVELYDNTTHTILDNEVVGNRITVTTGQSGIASFGTVGAVLERNSITGGTTAGIFSAGSAIGSAPAGGGLIIKGNRVRSVASGASGGVYLTHDGDAHVSDNYVESCGGLVPGISVSATSGRYTLRGNTSKANGGEGIYVNSHYTVVDGNTVLSNSQGSAGSRSGINIPSGITNCRIVNNTVGDDGSPTQLYGIQNLGTYTVLDNNHGYNNSVIDIFDGGTHTIKSGNRQTAAGGQSLVNRMDTASVLARSTVTYSASMQFSALDANEYVITATNGSAFTINDPTNPTTGQRITVVVRNTSGGALGAATWGTAFKMAAWTNPATGNSRSIDFMYDGTNWREVSRTPADVPN